MPKPPKLILTSLYSLPNDSDHEIIWAKQHLKANKIQFSKTYRGT